MSKNSVDAGNEEHLFYLFTYTRIDVCIYKDVYMVIYTYTIYIVTIEDLNAYSYS